ncbi:MAG: aminodeoxychorismate synthase component I [Candidatus Omnitrophota bacterium]|nr:aminodeoxychorismate synthase component I [Candidatus Omnitrophota bacterium]
MAIRPILEELGYFPDPVLLYSALNEEPYSSFLDSGMDEKKLGRFSFIAYDPFMVAECGSGNITVFTKNGTHNIKENPFRFIKDALLRYKTECPGCDIPFISGCIGYFSYDMRYFVEKLPSYALDDMAMPDFILSFYDVVIIFDNLAKKTYISSSGLPEHNGEDRKRRAGKRLEAVKRKLRSITSAVSDSASDAGCLAPNFDGNFFDRVLKSNFTEKNYYKAIEKAKDYIARGDIYQVNLSQRFECGFKGNAFGLYRKLRQINPAPFAAYLNFGKFKIVSSSPERFIKINGRYIETRPIKGTRPRNIDRNEDLRLKEELLSSVKDKAEHVMIVDLERNDMGRICEYGSIAPSEFAIPETYSTVHHLTSTVTGILREGTDVVDCLKNCFPGGSITGAPKIRSMEIIEEIEPTKRGIYTGSIGYIDFCGNLDLSIVIRTIILKENRAYFQVGGGIVADSDPEKEYQETLDKGRALAEAIWAYKQVHQLPVTGAPAIKISKSKNQNAK